MKKILENMVFIVCLVCISSFPGNAVGLEEEEIFTGIIIEIASEDYIIQVKNRNYIVTAVFVDDGITAEPEPGTFRDLKVGSVVEIHFQGKNDGFWRAKKVILFTGDKEKEKLKSLE
ncbi:MAG: hypothetical protein PVG39_08040 [Desulfobacteraceae bacterium]|jgi:hypothetical protein